MDERLVYFSPYFTAVMFKVQMKSCHLQLHVSIEYLSRKVNIIIPIKALFERLIMTYSTLIPVILQEARICRAYVALLEIQM